MQKQILKAGEDIKTGQLVVLRDGMVWKHEDHKELWEEYGYSSAEDAIKALKKNTPLIVAQGEHKHYK